MIRIKVKSFNNINDLDEFLKANWDITYIDLKIHSHIEYYDYNGLPSNQWTEYLLLFK